MGRRFVSGRLLVEFLGFLVIVVSGSITTVWVSNRFSTPIDDVVTGLGIVFVAVSGLWWLVKFDPESNAGRSSSLAGLGGALGVLVTHSFVSGDQYTAVGAAIGAGVGAVVGGFVWGRPSYTTNG